MGCNNMEGSIKKRRRQFIASLLVFVMLFQLFFPMGTLAYTTESDDSGGYIYGGYAYPGDKIYCGPEEDKAEFYGGYEVSYVVDGETVSTVSGNNSAITVISYNGVEKWAVSGRAYSGATTDKLTLSAVKKTYTVTFNKNDGSDDPETKTQVFEHGTPQTLSENSFSRDDYMFLGWSESETAQDPDYADEASYTATENKTLYAVWRKESCSVNFILNPEEHDDLSPNPSSIPPQTVSYNGHAENPGDPEDDYNHYDFEGWYTNNDWTERFDFSRSVSENLTLFANWERYYTVSFNNMGHGTKPEDQRVKEGGYAANPGTLSDNAWDFLGWYWIDDEIEREYEFTEDYPVYSDREIYAKWDPKSFTITYHLDEGTVSSSNPTSYTVSSNDITLNNPTKDGYEFAGWTGTDITGGPQKTVTIQKGSTGDREYFANWSAKEYDVTYNGNGATGGSTAAQKKEHGTPLTLRTNGFEKTGYTFKEWNTNKTGTGTSYGAGATYEGNAPLSLNAIWKPKDYNITYDLNGGSVSPANPTSYNVVSGSFTLNNPTKAGNEFLGWTGSNGDTPQKTVTVSSGSIGDRTYNANWKLNTYSVTYNGNGETAGSTENQTKTYGQSITLRRNGFTKTGYIFEKWNTKSDGTGQSYSAGATYKGNAPLSLYAIWKLNNYKITYSLNGGSVSPANPTSYNVVSGNFTLNKPTRIGHDFLGWTGSNGNSPQETVTITQGSTGDKNYTANWTPKGYRIDYVLNGGTNSPSNPDTYTYGEGCTLNNASRQGYDFGGWYGDSSLSGNRIIAISSTDYGDKTLYAKWIAKEDTQYTVEHYLQDPRGDYPSSASYTEIKYGTTGVSTNAVANEYEGFIKPATVSQDVIKPDGSTVIRIEYERKTHNLVWNLDGGSTSAASGTYTQGSVRYGQTITALPSSTLSKANYDFAGWDRNVPAKMPDEDVTIKAIWKAKEYSISYELNGGTNSSYNPAKYKYGVGCTFSDASRQGYDFAGWYGNSSLSGDKITGISKTDSGNKTLYAKWTAKGDTPYLVKHYLQNTGGGYPSSASYTETKYGKTDDITNAVANDYEGFIKPATVTQNVIKADGSTVITIKYERRKYTVVFDTDGGMPVPQNQSVVYEGKVIKPSDPEKQGYDFYKWVKPDKTTEFDFDKDVITGDITLTAIWIPQNGTVYTVKHYKQELDGTYPAEPSDINTSKGTTGEKTHAVAKSYEGFKAETPIADQVITGDGKTVVSINYVRQSYDLTWDFDGGSTSDTSYTNSGSIKFEAPITAPERETMSKTGHSFSGWDKTVPDSMPAKALTIKAKWNPNQYGISYVLNEGVNDPSNPYSYSYGNSFEIKPASRTGYDFDGWYGNSSLSGNKITGISATDTGDKKLYAKWTASTDTEYKVEHYKQNADGYYPLTASETEYKTGTTGAQTSAAAKSYSGFDAKDFSQETINGDGTTVVKIYYDRKLFTVSYNSIGGSQVPEQKVRYGAKAAKPADPVKDHNSFIEWQLNDARYDFTMPVTGDILLKALWRTQYSVEHWQQNANGDGYTKVETETESGKAGDDTAASPKIYDNFEPQPYSQKTIEDDGSTVVRIDYNRKRYLLTWDFDGGLTTAQAGEYTANGMVRFGAGITAPASGTMYKTGFVFEGWNVNVPQTMPSGDVLIKAIWSTSSSGGSDNGENDNEYGHSSDPLPVMGSVPDDTTLAVTFKGNGATEGFMGIQLFKPSIPELLSPNQYFRDGYDFLGWALSPTATKPVLLDKSLFITYQNVVLYAVWAKQRSGSTKAKATVSDSGTGSGGQDEYNIIYILSDGKNSIYNPIKYTYGVGVSSFYNATKAGYIFQGWYSDLKFTQQVTGISKKQKGNVTLYAKFVPDFMAANVELSEDSYDYDGSTKTPMVTLLIGGKKVPKNFYSVRYSNNQNVGTAKVTVTGKNGARGTIVALYKIRSAAGEAEIEAPVQSISQTDEAEIGIWDRILNKIREIIGFFFD